MVDFRPERKVSTGRSSRIDPALSLMLYLVGLLSMYLVDVRFAKLDEAVAADWAITRSSILLIAAVLPLGMDQSLVRSPSRLGTLGPKVLAQITVFGLLSSVVVAVLFDLGPIPSAFVGIASVGNAFTSILYSKFRVTGQLFAAQLVTQSWRPIALLLVFLGPGLFTADPPFMMFVAALPLIGLTVWYVFGADGLTVSEAFLDEAGVGDTDPTVGAIYKSAGWFLLTTAVLTVSLVGEQLLLGFWHDDAAAAMLLSHVTAVLYPIVVLNGFLNFFIGTIIRAYPHRFERAWSSWARALVPVCVLVAVLSFIVGQVGFPIVFGRAREFVPILGISLAAIGALRMIFIVPSAYVAVHANNRSLRYYSFGMTAGVIAMVSTAIILNLVVDLSALTAVMIGSLLNWSIRTLTAAMVFRSARREAITNGEQGRSVQGVSQQPA